MFYELFLDNKFWDFNSWVLSLNTKVILLRSGFCVAPVSANSISSQDNHLLLLLMDYNKWKYIKNRMMCWDKIQNRTQLRSMIAFFKIRLPLLLKPGKYCSASSTTLQGPGQGVHLQPSKAGAAKLQLGSDDERMIQGTFVKNLTNSDLESDASN